MKDPYGGSEIGRDLLDFRAGHDPKSITVESTEWSYLAGGSSGNAVLYLPGGTGHAEAAFEAFAVLERSCRVIVPSYPQSETMDQLVEGLRCLVESEDLLRVDVWGDSFGSMVAQRLVQTHPDMATALVLSHASVPTDERVTRARSQVRTFTKMPKFAARRLLKLAFRRLLGGTDMAEQGFWNTYLTETFAPHAKETVRNLARLSLDFYTGEFDPAGWSGRTLIVHVGGAPQEASMLAEVREHYPDATVTTVDVPAEAGTSKAAALCAPEVLKFVS